MDVRIQSPHFSNLEAIARNLEEVSLIDDLPRSEADVGTLTLSRNGELVNWRLEAEEMVFPARLVRSIYVGTWTHMGNTFAGLTLVFDRSGEDWAYRMLSADLTCTPWLEDVAVQISRIIGVSVVKPPPPT